jgi:hypothetical protein
MTREAAGITLVRMQGKWVLKVFWHGDGGYTIRATDFNELVRLFKDWQL